MFPAIVIGTSVDFTGITELSYLSTQDDSALTRLTGDGFRPLSTIGMGLSRTLIQTFTMDIKRLSILYLYAMRILNNLTPNGWVWPVVK